MPDGEWISFPDDKWNEITHNLWMGGMYYGPHMQPAWVEEGDFDLVISMAGNEIPIPASIDHAAYYIDDGKLGPVESGFVYGATALAVSAVMSGRKTLVRCAAGLNRSGLVVALALLQLPPFRGACCPNHAVALIQNKRSEHALHNPYFLEYIREAGVVHLNLLEGDDHGFGQDTERENDS